MADELEFPVDQQELVIHNVRQIEALARDILDIIQTGKKNKSVVMPV